MLPVKAQNHRMQAKRLRVIYPTSVGSEVEIFEEDISLGQTVDGVLDFQKMLQHAHAGEIAFRSGRTPEHLFEMKHVLLMIINGCLKQDIGDGREDMWNYIRTSAFKNLQARVIRKHFDLKSTQIIRSPEIIPPTEVIILWEYGDDVFTT